MDSIKMRHSRGFTLIEALCAVVLLGLIAPLLVHVYSSTLKTMEESAEETHVNSLLRSRMEQLLSLSFDQLANGTEAVMIDSESFPTTWTVVNVDLDGDLVPDPSAKRITVTVQGHSLVALVVDTGNMVGQI